MVVDPKVSIIIRTLNEEKHLGGLLEGIQSQTFADWEIIHVDSGSTDRTLQIIEPYAAKMLNIAPQEFTFGRSLNLGCAAASGEYLVIASAHVCPVTNTWLENLVQPFSDPSIGMVYGRQRGVASTRICEERDLLKTFGPTTKILIDEPFSHNGNSALRRGLWTEQPFNESLPGLEDLDWAKKIQKKGFSVGYAADAAVFHIHEESLARIYRRYRAEGIAYQSIFPGAGFSEANCLRAILTESARDFIYGIGARKNPKKLWEIPKARLAHFLGVYQGINQHKKRFRDLPKQLQFQPHKSKSVVVTGPGQHSLQKGYPPELGDDEVLVQVAYSGVCSADILMAKAAEETGLKSGSQYPSIPGQEYSGVVVKLGKRVNGFRCGDKVVGEWDWGIGSDSGELGANSTRIMGCYSHYLNAPGDYLHRLPADLPLRYSTLVKPLAMCLSGLDILSAHPNESACVLGAGPMGNLCAQVLLRRGLKVTVVDSNERRLKLLHKYDANTLRQQSSLKRFRYVIETQGCQETLASLLPPLVEASDPSAKILLLESTELEDRQIGRVTGHSLNREIYQVGRRTNCQGYWQSALKMIKEGSVDLGDHVDVVFSLEDYEKAWEVYQDQRHMKVLLNVSQELAEL